MQSWLSFYGMLGGAAATLLGLLFVSVSVNAQIILGPDHKHSRSLAEQAFQNYLAVLTLSLMDFLPGLSTQSFGFVVLGMTGAWSLWVVIRVYNGLWFERLQVSRTKLIRRYMASLIGFGMLIYSGAQMSLFDNDRRDDVGIGLLLLLFSATILSWELLISVAQEKYDAHRD